MRTPLRLAAAVGTALVLAAAAGCGQGPGSSSSAADAGRLDVVTAAYPLQHVAERVAGDDAVVSSALPPTSDVHEPELAPSQALRLAEADVVVHLPGLQPGVDAALGARPPARLVDVTGAAELRPDSGEQVLDPHFWLDPLRLAAVADQVGAELAAADPGSADGYRERAAGLRAELEALDRDYAAALAGCRGAVVVTSHEAFGYLAERYGLQQVGITGVDPDVEPTPARLRDVADAVADQQVETIFFETEASPGVAQVLADRLGTATGVLDPVETAPPGGGDYDDVARANLEALREGLACAA